jgi:hypothetical protein
LIFDFNVFELLVGLELLILSRALRFIFIIKKVYQGFIDKIYFTGRKIKIIFDNTRSPHTNGSSWAEGYLFCCSSGDSDYCSELAQKTCSSRLWILTSWSRDSLVINIDENSIFWFLCSLSKKSHYLILFLGLSLPCCFRGLSISP